MATMTAVAPSKRNTAMPTVEKNVVYFSFSIPNLKGQSPGGLFDVLSRLKEANLSFEGLSGAAYGKRMKMFCVPTDVNKFRDFAKQHQLHAREHHAIHITGTEVVVGDLVARWALSGIVLEGFSIAREPGGFVWSESIGG